MSETGLRKASGNKWAILAIVGIAVVAVVAAKAVAGSRPTPITTAAAPSTAASGLPQTFSSLTVSDPYPELPADQYAWALRNRVPAMLLFHSLTCTPCKEMEKLVGQVRGEYEEHIVFVDVVVNQAASQGLIRQMGVRYIPTSVFVDAAGQTRQEVGVIPLEALRRTLEELRLGR